MTKRQNPKSPFHGILVVDKPGWDAIDPLTPSPIQSEAHDGKRAALHGDQRLPTSHDIVQKVRRWSGQRRIGHTGTLDPLASGVLVLCLGLATRLVEYYQGHDKRYYAEVVLGTATDTYDAAGTVVERGAPPPLAPALIEAALAQFRGAIQQRPPAYSALKQGGESAHRRARRGETVELAARTVTFYALELVDILAPNRIALRAHSSAGTYIRSLAHDLGQVLGVPAHLARLRREAAGAFTVADAHTVSTIEAAANAGKLATLLHPPGARLHLPAYTLDDAQIRAFGFGQTVSLHPAHLATVALDIDAVYTASIDTAFVDRAQAARGQTDGGQTDGGHSDGGQTPHLAQAYRGDGRFLGIIRRIAEGRGQSPMWKAEKWLVVDGETV